MIIDLGGDGAFVGFVDSLDELENKFEEYASSYLDDTEYDEAGQIQSNLENFRQCYLEHKIPYEICKGEDIFLLVQSIEDEDFDEFVIDLVSGEKVLVELNAYDFWGDNPVKITDKKNSFKREFLEKEVIPLAKEDEEISLMLNNPKSKDVNLMIHKRIENSFVYSYSLEHINFDNYEDDIIRSWMIRDFKLCDEYSNASILRKFEDLITIERI